MGALWTQTDDPKGAIPSLDGRRYDHVVVGGGITGLSVALLLARAGRSVAVLEARHIGAGATGHTTGKLSLLQGTRLSSIGRHHSTATLLDYVEANRAGLSWLRQYCADHGVPVDERAAITYATSDKGARRVAEEHDACRSLDMPTELVECDELPFPTTAAVRLAAQAQLDPMILLRTMADDLQAQGADLYEGIRVRNIRRSGGEHRLITADGEVRADSVVIATGIPFPDRGAYFARLHAERSYAAAFSVDGPIPQSMYLSADDTSVSLRTATRAGHPDETLLLVGGFGHPVGRTRSELGHVDDMREWTRKWFPTAREIARWSAQDYRSFDEMPYIGKLFPGSHGVLIATGYAKWGLTNSVAAALAISERLHRDPPAWSHAFAPWRRSEVTALPSGITQNLSVAAQYARGYLSLLSPVKRNPDEGSGDVGHSGPLPRGVCRVDDATNSVAPLCTHLLGVLRWNDAERTWDCPLHGSRFDHRGAVLEGPATRPLAGLSEDQQE